MKRTFITVLLAIICLCGFAQTIDPVLLEEMGQRRSDEKIKVFVVMRQQYDQQELNRRAANFTTRAERREFVVNELKQFAEVSQYDLQHSLMEMRRNDMVTEPKVLWVANAVFFEATRDAILSLADRNDIMVIGFDEERNWLPDGEEATSATPTREITSNVTQVNADQVWDLGYTGQGVVVAVIDTGVNYRHLDLADHLWDGGSEFPYHGYDIYNDDNNPLDDHGHGTHCAGTVCGDGTAGSQTGIAPDATLMCVKCLNSEGQCYDSHLISAMQWAVDHGCDVISMSLGGHGHSGAEQTLIRNSCVNVLNIGVIAAISAGNEGNQLNLYPIPDNIGLPGGCPPPYLDPKQAQNSGGLSCSVCVGAVDSNDEAAYFTSQGPRDWSNSDYADYPYTSSSQIEFGLIRPDVCAPGVGIKSADFSNNSGYTTKSGTSMATPCVAGCMALMLSKDNNATPEELCRIIEETALPLTEEKSNIYGYGRVDVLAAINAMCSLRFESLTVNDGQGNNDGSLEAGETADLHIVISNIGNNTAASVVGTLFTEYPFLAINETTATFGDIEVNGQVSADFNVTLADSAPENYVIDFSLDLVDDNGNHSYLDFELKKWIIAFADANVKELCVSNWDADGDGELSYGEAETVTSLEEVFRNNSSMSSFDELQYFIGLTSIGNNAFYGCTGLTSVKIPNSVTSIGERAFFYCSSLISIEIPNLVTSIGGYAFYNCSNMTSIVIPNSVTSIGERAFFYCSNLISIEIPNSVTSIGGYAFLLCTGLTSITVLPNNPPVLGSYVFSQVNKSIPVYVPCGSLDAYHDAAGWNEFTNMIGLCSGEVSVTLNPLEGGTVTGAGYYDGGDLCVLTATPNPGYSFINWKENGVVVSTDTVYSFYAYPTTIVANFCSYSPIIFADANVKAICVANWDTNGDGELSYVEAAAVTSLGEVFHNQSAITSFDELRYFIGLTSISNYAFNGFNRLISIEIPNSVTAIGKCAFSNCSSLTSIEIPNSVTSISLYAFSNCSSLTSIEIPNSVTSMGKNPFSDCSGLEQIVVEEGNVVYDSRENCNAIINISTNELITGCKNTTIPSSVTSISDEAFSGCSSLISINIPDPVASIGSKAFYYCTGLTSVTVLADNPPALGSSVFFQVNKSIPVYAPCGSLEAYQNTDGWNEFNNIIGLCSGEVSVTVNPSEGGTITGAGYYTGGDLCVLTATPNPGFSFSNWTENGVVVSRDTVYSFYAHPTTIVANFTNGPIAFADISVKALCVANWDADEDGELSYAEAFAVTNLGEAFRYNSTITSFNELRYFTGLTSIGSETFAYCSSLTSIEIPNSVTSIGGSAFWNCRGLTSIEIPNSVVSIGDYAFYNCNSLTSTEIPNSVISIGDYAFFNCNSLTSIEIPNSMTSIGHAVFYNCSSLTSIGIPNSVTSIGSSAFSNCSGLTFIEIPNSMTSIGSSAFSNCSGLAFIEIPNSVTSIGSSAFYNCGSLTSIEIPNSVTSIGDYAFSGCSSLTFIGIPNSVISIGSYAFRYCSNLTSIEIPNSVTSIGQWAFYYCSSLTTIGIPNSVTSIGSCAFYGCTGLISMTVLADNPPFSGSYAFNGVNNSIPVYVPCGSLEAYSSISWGGFCNFEEMCPTQIIELNEGWNRISFYIETDDPVAMLNMLKASLGENGLIIESSDYSTEFDGEEWFGDLDNVGITNEQMYLILVNADCTIELQGMLANPASHAIPIYPGWNRIGYPCSVEVETVAALAGFQAEEGDILESPEGQLEFDGEVWFGDIEFMEPGTGYLYFSNSTEVKVLIYVCGGTKSK